MSRIRVGTSGWNYPGGRGTWNGVFYPSTAGVAKRKKSGFDELAFYAEHFDTVEVNSSFYGVPAPNTTKSWVDRTPANFEFSLKLYQKFTHPEMFHRATGQDPSSIDDADIDGFRRAIDPIAEAGKLGALLAQFPASFKNEANARGYLEWLLQAFKEYPLAVELRHRSFSDDPEKTLQAPQRTRRGARADRRAQVPAVDSPEPAFPTCGWSTTCACTGGTPSTGGSTRSPRIATTTCTRG